LTRSFRSFLIGPLMPLSMLAAAYVLSLLAFAFFRPETEGRVFFYPLNSGESIGSERRGIPARRDPVDEIDVFIDELLIGPVALHLEKTAPRGTTLRHVAVIDKTAYVDLDSGMLRVNEALPIDFDTAIDTIRTNILFNFPRIEDVVFTINGHQIHAPYYAGA